MVRLSVVVRCVVLLLVCAVGRFSFAAGTEERCFSSLSVTSSATNVVDFGGACVGGYARFSVVRRQCAEGRPPVLRIAYATHPDGLGPKGDFCRETAARYLGPDVDLPIWPANIDRYETYVLDRDGDYRAPLLQGLVRYAAFSLDTPGCAVEIDGFALTNDCVHSEGELDGSFRCSDERLNALWRASVRSCELSAIPSYLATNVTPAVRTLPYLADGAKRDRLVWSGDLWWAERNVFYGFRTDEPYMRGSLRMLAANRTPEGYVQACPWPEQRLPKAGEYGPFPSDEFAAWFVPVLWDYHLYRDDRTLLAETWPVVRDLIGYLGRHRNADGIFEQRPETSKHAAALVFGDSSCHHRAYMNILLWQTYAEAAKIAKTLGHAEEASRWRREADGLATAVRRLFWTADRGHFVLSLEDRSFNFEANALALANGFVHADEAARIIPQLVRVGHGKFQALAVRGSFACGDAEAAMRLLAAHNWFALVDPAWKGAQLTSECAHLIRTGWGDEAHPDTAVAGILSASVLGIEPVEPGFRKFRFKPHPAGGVTWAEGTVPTPHGPIRASWRLEDGRLVTKLENPPGTARTVDPVADCREVGSATYRPLRRELRAFYPDECHGRCKSPDFDRSADAITNEVTQWAAAHPGFDALDLRRESYRAMRRHFRPFLFHESPFYFESGVNGGWCFKHVPARVVNRLCEPIRRSLVPPSAFARMNARAGARLAFCCGPFVDDMHHVPAFRVLREKGFKGVLEETKAALESCPADDPLGRKELETALEGLETIHDLQLKFADEAERRLKASDLPARERRWLERIAESARRCPWEPPRTFFEGLNFLWFVREIPSYVDGLSSYSLGRPDAWFIDLYRQDLAAGRLTVEEAKDLVARWLVTSDCHYDGMITVDGGDDHEAEMPMTLGGCDAEGRPVWNELTEMFIDLHVETDCVFPKLNVRFDAHSPQAYLERIAQCLIDGHAAFALFNDVAALPGFVAHGIPLADARDYVACGCWDGNVDTWTDVDAGNYMSAARVLELTIYPDRRLEERIGVTFDPIDGATSFEEVKRIYMRNLLRVYRTTVSDYTRYGRTASKAFPHPAYSACLKGCLERRRDTTDGGTAFRPRVMTLGFAASVADSLAAIEQVVFKDRRATLPEFLDAVRSNWKGPRGAELRAAALASPYWGDNRPESNALVRWLFTGVADGLEGFRNDNDGPYVISAWIYREFLYWGLKMRATPDGRFDGDRLTQGFTPSDYRCEGDVTTVINAIGSAPHDRLYASNANLTFEKDGMTPQVLAAVFRVFGEKGGHLLQPNCNSVDELLDAQKHPERHLNLFVKVCGFSARFIALSKRWQDEVIARHRLK